MASEAQRHYEAPGAQVVQEPHRPVGKQRCGRRGRAASSRLLVVTLDLRIPAPRELAQGPRQPLDPRELRLAGESGASTMPSE